MKKTLTKNGLLLEVEVSLEFKKKVGKLLNQLMKDYGIKGDDKSSTNAFKDILKSNLYIEIDNEYHKQNGTL